MSTRTAVIYTRVSSREQELLRAYAERNGFEVVRAMSSCGFCAYSIQAKLFSNAHDPAIIPVLELYNFAKRAGVAVFFITGRQEAQRQLTIGNLQEVGYSGWTDLIMQTDGNKLPARVFKSNDRRALEKGYRIVLGIGDQASDLVGCCAERIFKLPNPFYQIP